MPAIHHIETVVPEHNYSQAQIAETLATIFDSKKARQYIRAITADSGIDRRFSVIPNFMPASGDFFSVSESGELKQPGTGQRNQLYVQQSRLLLTKLARQLRTNIRPDKLNSITHIITVSCTGFYNPGADLDLIAALGLPNSIERYNLGFMGCYAAFPAMKMAAQFCKANSQANVLIVCLELCSLHFQLKDDLDSLIANTVFADGAAAALVSNQKSEQASLALESFHSNFLPEGRDEMAWDIGDYGFDMTLSKYVPKIIAANIEQILEAPLKRSGKQIADFDLWAIHPGGKSILDKVESSLEISANKLEASRQVLRDFGNMSSATILFVLAEILKNAGSSEDKGVFGLAFGPGLVVESATLRIIQPN